MFKFVIIIIIAFLYYVIQVPKQKKFTSIKITCFYTMKKDTRFKFVWISKEFFELSYRMIISIIGRIEILNYIRGNNFLEYSFFWISKGRESKDFPNFLFFKSL